MDVSDLTYEVWSGLVGETFAVALDDGSVASLRLEDAELAAGENRLDDAYSVVFVGSGEVFLEQRIWPISHPVIGSQQLFLVPVGEADGGYRYEAVFTRMKN